jgi:quinol monooxygenase YgiN
MIHLTGTLTCATERDLAILEVHLPNHIHFSRAEPGCISFSVSQTANPLVWQLDESFVNQAAFDAHQVRTRASKWWQVSQHIARDFQITQV